MSTLQHLLARTAPLLLGTRGKQRLAILNYHRVMPSPDPMRPVETTAETFRWQMQLLAKHFQPIALEQALEHLWEGTLPERAVCVTFDDGYADNLEVALPILVETGIPATIFIATGYIDVGLMWNDTIIEFARVAEPGFYRTGEHDLVLEGDHDTRRRAAGAAIRTLKHLPFARRQSAVDKLATAGVPLPSGLMLSTFQLRELGNHELISLGAHTVSHPILEALDDIRAAQEITQSREQLEHITHRPVNLFAYPNGKPGTDYSGRHCRMVEQAGFNAALSTNWGVASSGSDRYQLPRFTPWDRQPTRFLLRLLMNYARPT